MDPIVIDPAAPVDRPLFQVVPTLPESVSFDVKPLRVALDLPPSAFPARLGGFPDTASSPYARRKGAFSCAVRGAAPFADRIWFFRDGAYVRYFEKPERRDETSGWLPIAGNWQLPEPFTSRVDAALTGAVAPFVGQMWFFSHDQYVRYNPAGETVVRGPLPIAGNWGLPDGFTSGLDAVIHGVGDYLGKAWFFKGGQYVRYDVATDTTEFGPAPIAGNWHGWPDEFADGVDFAFYGTGPHEQHIYFFRGDRYLRYDLPADRVEEGPLAAVDAWPALGGLMPVPQLFLSERYKLYTFHGQIGNGGQVGTMKIGPKETSDVWVITKTRQTTTESSSSNVLESTSQQTVDNFSNDLRQDTTDAGSSEQYDYGMDASFRGEAHATGLTGGEANADLHVKGSTQDTRREFSKAVGSQINRAQQDSHEQHAQQVRMTTNGSEIDTQTESGFRQTVDNSDNPHPITVMVYQLTQEYILVLSLVDAELVFRNGDDRAAESAPIGDMRRVLDKCVENPAVRDAVAKAVTEALSTVVDGTTDAERSLLTADGSRVDPLVRTHFQALDTTGQLVRDVVVDGIAIRVDRPVVLTPNTALATLSGSD